jgi:hypothetical protein
MSDHWICIIPKDPHYVPSESAIVAAERFLSEIAPDAEKVSSEIADTIQFRDCGANLESIRCQTCASELPMEWWASQLGDEDFRQDGFKLRPVDLPCGHVAPSLNDLTYLFDQGFSRFMLDAMNPSVGALTPAQIRQCEVVLGCPIKVIYQHI